MRSKKEGTSGNGTQENRKKQPQIKTTIQVSPEHAAPSNMRTCRPHVSFPDRRGKRAPAMAVPGGRRYSGALEKKKQENLKARERCRVY